MFKIADGRDRLYQWDTNIKLTINESANIDEAHFTTRFSKTVLRVQVIRADTGSYVLIPNILLQQSYDIVVYGYCHVNNCTTCLTVLPVEKKPKPPDYVYTETEILSYYELEKRISALEDGTAMEDLIVKSVGDYLIANPPSGLTIHEIDKTLHLSASGVLSVNTTNEADQDNTLPITSAGVFATVGNIEILLKTI